MTRLSRSTCAVSTLAVERGATRWSIRRRRATLEPPDDGLESETGQRAAGGQRERDEERREIGFHVGFHGGYPVTLTLRLLTTDCTPFTPQAMLPARCLRSSLGTTPFR